MRDRTHFEFNVDPSLSVGSLLDVNVPCRANRSKRLEYINQCFKAGARLFFQFLALVLKWGFSLANVCRCLPVHQPLNQRIGWVWVLRCGFYLA